MITLDLIRQVSSPSVKHEVLNELVTSFNTYLPLYELNTPLRYCAFLSQCAHETALFKYFYELGTEKYFEKYEPGTKIGKILGNTKSGDGYRFRGRGDIMLTGRGNYTTYSKIINVDLLENPNKAAEPLLAAQIACEFWNRKKLSPLADEKNIAGITVRINGGYNGLANRELLYNKLLKYVENA